jgi:hypothetical protein
LGRAVSAVATVANVKTARYFGPATQAVSSSLVVAWNPEMRYRSPSMTPNDAQAWCNDAQAIYLETVGQMRLDGVI